ncbi:hypothetical protein [Acrocarpospora catenulata]|uniref:hypothetical protein n=1 Tax=Acrocarpospora catenulata TaxID=2836182 RepID=UPI001BDA3CEF|nr:hypothetical protein [Acrocarpospora catenulata]
MSSLIVVPVHLDALCLERSTDVSGPTADFTRLPYAAEGGDQHADQPYLSDIVVPEPFEDQDFRLKAGVHLHWALPDGLTRMVQQDDGQTSIPAVPDRWLVTRSRDGVVEAQWVVESDVFSQENVGAIAYPLSDGPETYRRLGRQVPLNVWSPTTDPAQRLPLLTAVGYGEPAFAAYYPNCHSVFGLHDPAYPGVPPAGLSYDVVGWYQDLSSDPLTRLQPDPDQTLTEKLEEQFDWNVTEDGPFERIVCVARLTFQPAEDTTSPLLSDDTGVWVGNTATEALAAHLGAVLPATTPAEAEHLLEALSFAEELESQQLDLGLTLAENRHAATFRSLPGGTLWTIVREDEPGDSSAEERQARENLTLPPDACDLLDELNRLQSAYDNEAARLTGLRERLFADWHKYLLCAYPYDTTRDGYPDPDLVKFFIERQLRILQRRSYANGERSEIISMRRSRLEWVLRQVDTETARASFVVKPVAAPQYYLPNEPVVLFTGDAATPTDRHGQDGAQSPDGLLRCHAVTDPGPAWDAGTAGDLRDAVLPLAEAQVWRHAPWHPVLLHWQVEFFPSGQGGNLSPNDRTYDEDYVTRTYELASGEVELTVIPGQDANDKAANVYSGVTLLSPAARPVLSARVLRYLEGALLPRYGENMDDPEKVFQRYLDQPAPEQRLVTLIEAYRHLAANEGGNLAGVLGGFNDALLMRKLVRQLPVDDPLGFRRYQDFAGEVKWAIGNETTHAPQPLSDFAPIRAGAMRVLALRLVDNFGVGHDVDVRLPGTTTELTVPDHPGWVAMPPRLAQPTRISARWLDARYDRRESNSTPESTPVCGWLLPDNLDDGVAVFAADGRMMGALYAVPDLGDPTLAQWRGLPGAGWVGTGEIPDEHLRAVVARLRTAGPDRLGEFVAALSDALDAIEPEEQAQHRARAILTGRPLAVVRAAINLELQGVPAVHQDWNVFRQDLARTSRESNDFPLVRFPVRIGSHHHLDDGVVGYWVEGESPQKFHSILDAEPILQAIDEAPHVLTLLLDPRGKVHVTSGVLPCKTLDLPAQYHAESVSALESDFFTAPVLAAQGDFGLPLPDEPGFAWSWRERTGADWAQLDTAPTALDAQFPPELSLREGWLALRPYAPPARNA